jgi:hypothetical protein
MHPASPAETPTVPVEAARLKLAQIAAQPELALPEVFRRVCETAADTLAVERAGIWLFVNGDRAMRCVSLFERSGRKHTKGTLLHVGEFPEHLRAAWPTLPCEDTAVDPRTAELRDTYLAPHGITSLLDAPIMRDDRLVGVVSHEHTGPPRTWTADERTFARVVADVVVERMRAAEGALTRPATWPMAQHAPAPPTADRPASLAHDLRDALSGVLADAALVARIPGLPPEALPRLARIEEAVRKAEAIIRERLTPGGEVVR